MIATRFQQHATCTGYWSLPIQTTGLRCVTEDGERGSQFVKEQVWRSEPIPSPPVIDFADLSVCFACSLYRKIHRRRRSSSRIADAGRS